MDQKLITSMLIGALALWVLYRRVRRNIGRQPLNARRMGGRIVLLAVHCCCRALPIGSWSSIQPRTRQRRRTEIRLRRTRKVHSRSRFSGW